MYTNFESVCVSNKIFTSIIVNNKNQKKTYTNQNYYQFLILTICILLFKLPLANDNQYHFL